MEPTESEHKELRNQLKAKREKKKILQDKCHNSNNEAQVCWKWGGG